MKCLSTFLLVACALVFAAPPASAEDTRAIERLLYSADIDFERLDSGALKMVLSFTDGRSHLVFIKPLSKLRDEEAIEIYAPVMQLRELPSQELSHRLLLANGSFKIGYFGVEEVEGTLTVFAYHNLLLKGLRKDVLETVLWTVAEIADEMEKEQLGEDSDEY